MCATSRPQCLAYVGKLFFHAGYSVTLPLNFRLIGKRNSLPPNDGVFIPPLVLPNPTKSPLLHQSTVPAVGLWPRVPVTLPVSPTGVGYPPIHRSPDDDALITPFRRPRSRCSRRINSCGGLLAALFLAAVSPLDRTLCCEVPRVLDSAREFFVYPQQSSIHGIFDCRRRAILVYRAHGRKRLVQMINLYYQPVALAY